MRKLTYLFILAIALSLVLISCGGGGGEASVPEDSPEPFGDAVAGQELFLQSCAACHGTDAKGLPSLGKDMTVSEFIKGQSNEELLAFVKQGRPISDPASTTGVDMPPKGGNPALTDDQLKDIIAFIRTTIE